MTHFSSKFGDISPNVANLVTLGDILSTPHPRHPDHRIAIEGYNYFIIKMPGYFVYFYLFLMFDLTDVNKNARCTTRSYNSPKSQISTLYNYPFLRNASTHVHTYIQASRKKGSNWLKREVKMNISRKMLVFGFHRIPIPFDFLH